MTFSNDAPCSFGLIKMNVFVAVLTSLFDANVLGNWVEFEGICQFITFSVNVAYRGTAAGVD